MQSDVPESACDQGGVQKYTYSEYLQTFKYMYGLHQFRKLGAGDKIGDSLQTARSTTRVHSILRLWM